MDTNVIASLVTTGDLSRLTNEEKAQHYLAVCNALGLTAATQPFSYLRLNGKEILYANRACTEQLCSVHKLSVEVTGRQTDGDVHMVFVRVWQGKGGPSERFADGEGAVPLSGLKGEALANAYLKCATKARRRAVLAFCGLSLLDETEVETIHAAKQLPTPPTVLSLTPGHDAHEEALMERLLAGDQSVVEDIKWHIESLAEEDAQVARAKFAKAWRETNNVRGKSEDALCYRNTR